jgi:hypothetical protein
MTKTPVKYFNLRFSSTSNWYLFTKVDKSLSGQWTFKCLSGRDSNSILPWKSQRKSIEHFENNIAGGPATQAGSPALNVLIGSIRIMHKAAHIYMGKDRSTNYPSPTESL